MIYPRNLPIDVPTNIAVDGGASGVSHGHCREAALQRRWGDGCCHNGNDVNTRQPMRPQV